MTPGCRRVARALLATLAAAAWGCAAHAPAPAADTGPVWTWRGERRVSTFLEVPAGVTLRLEPGTVVRFAFRDADGDGIGDAGLHVLGRIEAVGTAAAPIVFASAEARPQPGDWRGLVFDSSAGNVFAFCRLEHAEHALHAHFSSATLTRCRLERNVEGTRLGNSRFEIAFCLVRGNASKGLNFFSCANRIRRNLVTGNGNGIFLFQTDTDSVIEENDIYGNERYDLRLGDFFVGGKALGRNWWGTADAAEIRRHIYDGESDPALGRVTFDPAPAPFTTGWEGE